MLFRPKPRLIALVIALSLIAVVAAVLASHWPFNQAKVIHALEEVSSSRVLVAKYQKTFFPFPGCTMEGVVITRTPGTDAPPLLTAKTLTIQGSWFALMTLRHRVAELRAEGLRIFVPEHMPPPLPIPTDNIETVASQFVADGAILEVASRDGSGAPLRFDFPQMTMYELGKRRAIRFRTVMQNPNPPSHITANGSFGPWHTADAGSTPVSGSFDFSNGDLGHYKGIAGILSSRGEFGGTLGQIAVRGRTAIPDFEVRSSGHKLGLQTQYEAVVNGMNGDTMLRSVQADFLNTKLGVEGGVTGMPGEHGKTVSVNFDGRKARIEDLLQMFVSATPPAMKGAIAFRAHVVVPPKEDRFLRKLRLDGQFEIAGGRFTKPITQANVNQLSANARGDGDANVQDAEDVFSDVKGRVSVRGGVATFPEISFTVPGALASGSGTYNLLTQVVNVQGTLAMAATLSEASHGFKSILLKPLNRFFEKKYAGAVVAVHLTGTYSHPSFGVSLTGKKSDRVAARLIEHR